MHPKYEHYFVITKTIEDKNCIETEWFLCEWEKKESWFKSVWTKNLKHAKLFDSKETIGNLYHILPELSHLNIKEILLPFGNKYLKK